MSVDTDLNKQVRNVAIAMGAIGTLWIATGGMCLFMMTAQKAILTFGGAQGDSKVPLELEPFKVSFENMLTMLHQIWSVWMPFLSLLGVFWVVCSVLLGFGGRRWRSLALVAVCCAVGWTLGYSYACIDFIEAFKEVFLLFPVGPPFFSELISIGAFFGFVFLLLKPLAVGFFVWRF